MLKYIIATTILLIFCLVCLFAVKSCKNKKKLIQSENIAVHQFDSVKYFNDLYNNEHANVEQLSASKDVITAFFSKKIDSISKELNIKKKQIKGITNSSLVVSDRVITKTNYIHDTTIAEQELINWSGYYFTWADTFATINGYVDSFNTQVVYSINVPLTYTKYWKRKHKFLGIRFGRKIYFMDAFSENKQVHIKNLKDIQIN